MKLLPTAGWFTLAQTLGFEEAATILVQTLEEEKRTNEFTTEIAQNNINWEAEQEGETGE